MNEQLSGCRTEQEIRARFRCAPAYYLQAKLEKLWALGGHDCPAGADKESHTRAVQLEKPIERATLPEPASLDVLASVPEPAKSATPAPEPAKAAAPAPEPAKAAASAPKLAKAAAPAAKPAKAAASAAKLAKAAAPPALEAANATIPVANSPKVAAREPKSAEDAILEFESLNAAAPARERPKVTRLGREIPEFALPGFEILDAALSEFDSPEDPAPAALPRSDPELTQQAILAAALEGYSNWPFLADPDPELEQNSRAGSELERKLALVLASEPDLELVLDSESELELELALETEPDSKRVSDNVTVADFGHRAPRTVRVVSVVMDRKRPNMVRVASESTRLAS